MELCDALDEKLVFLDIENLDKRAVLKKMSDKISDLCGVPEDRILDALISREELTSTGIGSGLAIPHARISGIHEHYLAFGRSVHGMDYEAVDGKPVYILFLLLSPPESIAQHLQFLARLSKYLHDTSFREKLLRVREEKKVIEIIREKARVHSK